MKIGMSLFVLCVSLFARENPFVPFGAPQTTVQEVPMATFHPLSPQELTFPQDAKVLKKVAAQYQRFDGTTAVVTKEIHEEIDWRKPVIFSQVTNRHLGGKKGDVAQSPVTISTSFQIKESFVIDDEKPRRFVVDFLKEHKGKPSIEWEQGDKLSRVMIGKHNKTMRVVFYISPDAKPLIKKQAEGYSVTF